MKQAIIWGAKGQAKVIYPILTTEKYQIVGMVDKNPEIRKFQDHIVYKTLNDFETQTGLSPSNDEISFALAIGGTFGQDRLALHDLLLAKNYLPVNLFHQTAWVAESARVREGCQILAMSSVCEGVELGIQTIINTNASVDHECLLGAGVHVMPGATIAGCVQIGDCATIGANATILPYLKIGKGAVIGAGAVVTKDVAENTTVVGVPARLLEK